MLARFIKALASSLTILASTSKKFDKKIGLFLLIFIISAFTATYFQWEISQAKASFPPPPADIRLAVDKSYGVNIDLSQYPEPTLDQTLDAIAATGLVWLRQPFHWAEIEVEQGQFEWQSYDTLVQAAHTRGFKIIAVLDTSPVWARAAETSPHTPPTEATDFGRFAQAVAQRYANQIDYYQIWHEPNLSERWGNAHVNVSNYVHLLKNATIPIRATHPQAKILAASLAPTTENGPLNLNEFDYLEAMYQNQAAPWFDIMGGQLYGFHLPITPTKSEPNLLNIHRVTRLRQIMVANGDTHKPIWATAFGWHALPADWAGHPPNWPSDIPAKQITRTIEALDYARSNWSWLGPILAIRWDSSGLAEDDSNRGFAINPTLLTPFETAAQYKPAIATLGDYPATHDSGQYSPGWLQGGDVVDIPHQLDNNPLNPSLSIPFEGTRLDLKINRGLYQGYLHVQIDDHPSQVLPLDENGESYIVLYDPLRQPDTVIISRYLADGPHQATIEATGGWGQWAIAGWRVGREADIRFQNRGLLISLVIMITSAGGLLWSIAQYWALLWQALTGLWVYLYGYKMQVGQPYQIGFIFVLAIAFYWLPQSLALLCLPLLGLAFLLRPDIGLMILTTGISFFLAKKALPIGTFFILEIYLALLVLAIGLRFILPQPPSLKTIRFSQLVRQINGADGVVLALVILATLTTWTANLRGVALYELRTVIMGGAVFYFLIRLIPHFSQLKRGDLVQYLIDAFIAGATLHAISALYQYIFVPSLTINAEGVQRAIGYFYGSPNNLSLFLDRTFPFLVIIMLFGLDKQRRFFYAIALLVVSSTLFLTFSKGSLLLAIPAAIVFLALMKGGKRAWFGAGLAMVLLIIALIPLARTERFFNTFSFEPGSTAFFRLKLWQSAWQILQEYPLTGLGLDNFLYEYRTHYISPQAWAEPNLSHPHNFILDFGTRLGVGGIVVLIWLLGRFWQSSLKGYFSLNYPQVNGLLLGLMGSMIPFLVHGLVDHAFFLVDLAYVFFLVLGCVEILLETDTEIHHKL